MRKGILIVALLLLASPAFAAGPTYSGNANFAKEAGGEVYCSGGDTSCLSFMSSAVSYKAAHPAATITVTGVVDACYNVTAADYSGPSGDLGLNVVGYSSCSTDHIGQSVSITINDPPPPPAPSWMPDPTALLAAVTTSVQLTGSTFWSMLSYLGIPIAFVIAFWVIELLRAMNKRRNVGRVFHIVDGKRVYDKDQALGRAIHDVQTRGMTEFE